MNIADVLAPTISSGMNESPGGKKAEGTDLNSLLFAILLQNYTGLKTGSQEQSFEKSADIDQGQLTEQQAEQKTEQIVPSLGDSFLIFQNFFPAGKEATSGSNQVSPLNGFDSPVNPALGGMVKAESAAGIPAGQLLPQTGTGLDNGIGTIPVTTGEPEGMIGSVVKSQDPAELEKYIEPPKLLRELNGQIEAKEPVKNSPAQSAGNPGGLVQELGTDPSQKPGIAPAKEFSAEPGQGINPEAGNNPETGKEQMHTERLTQNSRESVLKAALVPDIAAEGKKQESGFSGERQTDQGLSNNFVSANDVLQSNLKNAQAQPAERTIFSGFSSLEPAKVWGQVLDILKKQDLKNGDIRELTLQMQPSELGKVHISVRYESGTVHVFLSAAEQLTENILQNNLQALRDGLSQAGVSCGTLGMGSSQENGQSGKNWGYLEDQPQPVRETGEEEISDRHFPGFYTATLTLGRKINLSA